MSRGKIRTYRPDGTQARYLNAAGPVAGLKWSYQVPGGCYQLSASLQIPPDYRVDAMDPGRITQVLLGGSVVWEGILDEPTQGDNGWDITAHGSGTWGSGYTADYTGTAWSGAAIDAALTAAASRGLNWTNAGFAGTTGLWLGQQQDPGSLQIDDLLNLACSLGGLTWQVKRTPAGNTVAPFVLPTTPTRLLVVTDPAARTLGGDINAIEIRYCATPDLGAGYPAAFALTWATDAASIAKHGRMEAYLDLSDVGAMLATDAQAVGNYILNRYQRAQFAGPFTVRPGQLLTTGGQPVDLGCFYIGNEGPMVCKLLLADEGWGGEVKFGSGVVFIVGQYEYDDDLDQATITPFNSLFTDFQGLLSARGQAAHGRRISVWRGSKALLWEFIGTNRWHERFPYGRRPHGHRKVPGGGGPPA